MRELSNEEMESVNGGIGPLAIIAIDLALNAVIIGAATLMTSDYFTRPGISNK